MEVMLYNFLLLNINCVPYWIRFLCPSAYMVVNKMFLCGILIFNSIYCTSSRHGLSRWLGNRKWPRGYKNTELVHFLCLFVYCLQKWFVCTHAAKTSFIFIVCLFLTHWVSCKWTKNILFYSTCVSLRRTVYN